LELSLDEGCGATIIPSVLLEINRFLTFTKLKAVNVQKGAPGNESEKKRASAPDG
jgi:hypothetical protein